MIKIPQLLAGFVLLPLAALAHDETEPVPPEPFEQVMIFRSGAKDIQFVHPFVFRWGTWVQFDEDENGDLLICLTAHAIGDCLFTYEPPGTIWGVELVPHCQDETLALSFEVLRDPEPSIFIYFNDGMVTLDRAEAEQMIEPFPECQFQPDQTAD